MPTASLSRLWRSVRRSPARPARPSPGRRRAAFHPLVEALEDRSLLSAGAPGLGDPTEGASPFYFVAVEFSFVNSPVYGIDPDTGAGTLLGLSGVSRLNSGARNSAGTFHSVGGIPNRILVTIDPLTGAATPAATLPATSDPTVDYRSLAFSPGDVLFGIRQSAMVGPFAPELVTISASTGDVTVIRSSQELSTVQGLTFSPSGTLYGWKLLPSLGLVTIDPVSGLVTDVNPAVGSVVNIQGLGFAPDGTLYGATGNSLYRIDPATGVPTLVGTGGYADVRSLDAFVPSEPAQIDIKPGESPNRINLRSSGVLPVAVLTTPSFDAAAIDTADLSTIRFGDVSGMGRVSPLRSALDDVDGDGDLDLILHFSMRQVREAGALTADSTQAELTGVTAAGSPIRGTDSVEIVPQEGGGLDDSDLGDLVAALLSGER